MKKVIILSISILFFSIHSFSQNNLPEKANKFNFGFNLNNYQNDFGIGLNITSPFLAGGYLAFRGRANLQFLQHLTNDGTETTWSPYQNYQLGVVGVGGTAGGFARFYGEGGVVFVTPSSEFSSSSLETGGYGLFGFEFFMSSQPDTPIAYFIELGGMGLGASADKVPGQPIYSNGFTASVGFRMYLIK